MKNDEKQLNSEMSVVKVLEMMKELYPHFKKEIQDAIHAYECPFEHFCEMEAKYRMDEAGFEGSNEEQEEIEAEIARRLYRSDTYLDNDVSSQITEDVIEKYKNKKEPEPENDKTFTFYFRSESSEPITLIAANEREALGRLLYSNTALRYIDLLIPHNTIPDYEKSYSWHEEYMHSSWTGKYIRHIYNEMSKYNKRQVLRTTKIVFEYENLKYTCFICGVSDLCDALGIFFYNHQNISFQNILEISH